MEQRVSLREVKHNLTRCMRVAGERIVITRCRRPVAVLLPAPPGALPECDARKRAWNACSVRAAILEDKPRRGVGRCSLPGIPYGQVVVVVEFPFGAEEAYHGLESEAALLLTRYRNSTRRDRRMFWERRLPPSSCAKGEFKGGVTLVDPCREE
ncbi:MAG TPA: hypothetical protein VN493_10335 [Thermoanaerobaculia bacterium]|nr:hypothetical protein [Thermoanaerobaculia bacterium]